MKFWNGLEGTKKDSNDESENRFDECVKFNKYALYVSLFPNPALRLIPFSIFLKTISDVML